ncbi:hypothetical protein CY35_01G035700 [Sphagnum magellanicum]|nr:hypothetical protein CY35_01G035700 [Sphagnum magellanicum]
MSTRMLACMTPKNLDEATESGETTTTTTSCDSRPDLRRLKAFTCQLKELALKVTAGAYKHSCRPCTASVYDQDAAQAAGHHHHHPVPSSSSETATEIPNGQFSSLPPSSHHHYKDDCTTLAPSCAFVRGAMAEVQMLNSKDCAQCWNQGKNDNQGGPNAVRVSEETKASNGMAQHMEQSSPGTEWFSQVELGVFVTFIALSNGCNALKRIRFSREIFSKTEAESWWTENGNRIRAMYNALPFEQTAETNEPTSSSDEEEEVSGASDYATPAYSPGVLQGLSQGDSMKSSRTGFSSPSLSSMRDAASIKAESVADERPHEAEAHENEESSEDTYDDDDENSWVEEDVPGVYLTLMILPGGARDLKRVRFSRDKFTERQAKIWWNENRSRIHTQYL